MSKLCSIEGCISNIFQLEYCNKHYKRWYRHGDPHYKRKTMMERFYDKIDLIPFSTCWYWSGYLDKNGYGSLKINKSTKRAHRISYEIHKEPIPSGLIVMHSCDTPTCVNPDHLLVGTYAENSADMVKKGRSNSARGERSGSSKLKEKDIIEIRDLLNVIPKNKIAALYGVNRGVIYKIMTRRIWSHV